MKYYITADVYGSYSELHKALDEAGYFSDPEPQKQIIVGDPLTAGRKTWGRSTSFSNLKGHSLLHCRPSKQYSKSIKDTARRRRAVSFVFFRSGRIGRPFPDLRPEAAA